MGASKACILLFTIQLVVAVTAQEVVRRVPQGFLGMRGKKYNEYGESEFYKRKPQFFVGVKGKKSVESYADKDYKRAPMGFLGMRGKKELYPDLMLLPDNYEYNPNQSGSLIGQIDYTAASGQNSIAPVYPILNDVITEYLNRLRSNVYNDIPSESNEISDESVSDVEKRAKFYGVRGKKSVQMKRPYDVSFRGKFIGVRGKKDMKNSGAQDVKFLLESWPKRRAQAGFFGVRGKKWTEDDTVLDSQQSSEIVMPNEV